MTLLAETVDLIIEELNHEVVVNSECEEGLTQRIFDSNTREFANVLLANPSIVERVCVTAEDVAKFVSKVLDDLDFELTDGVKTILAILSNPRLLQIVKEERDNGELE